MLSFLSSTQVQSLLRTHPNDTGTGIGDWDQIEWTDLVKVYNGSEPSAKLPDDLAHLISQIQSLQLERTPIDLPSHSRPKLPSYGLSPKKQHEVDRMTDYVESLLTQFQSQSPIRIVDVGAGQGYLTRSLAFRLRSHHILALDSDQAQSAGAQKWETKILPSPSPITHRTIHITPTTLIESIDEWIACTRTSSEPTTTPVLLVALHACGSLTPSILRAFLESSSRTSSAWTVFGLVVVGCCYNLLHPSDLPLCHTPDLKLPPAAPQLAAQVPATWLNDLPAASLSVKKVVWRALLSREMQRQGLHETVPHLWREKSSRHGPLSEDPLESKDRKKAIGIGTTPAMRRLGKLNDAVYNDWQTFLAVASQRLGADLTDAPPPSTAVQNRISVLHTLRSLLGPVIESFIVHDRVQFLSQGLQNNSATKLDVRIVNLFDQNTGSGRNIALVVAPSPPQVPASD